MRAIRSALIVLAALCIAVGVEARPKRTVSSSHRRHRRSKAAPAPPIDLVVPEEVPVALPLPSPSPLPPPSLPPPEPKSPRRILPPPDLNGDLQRAIALSFQSNDRGRAIALLEALLPKLSDPRPARHALARALSWDHHLDEALSQYDTLLRDAPTSGRTALELERLQVLLWMGKTAIAERGYRQILEQEPRNVDALVGRARALRWLGRKLAARRSAERAVAIAPTRVEAKEELAWSYAATREGREAESILGAVGTESAELRERLIELRRPHPAVSGVLSGNSFGIDRIAPRASVDISLPHDFRLIVGGGMSHLAQGSDRVDYGVVGGAISFDFGPLRLVGEGTGYFGKGFTSFDAGGSVGLRPIDELGFAIGVRHRPFIELAEPLATDERAFYAAGVGGAQLLTDVLPLTVNDLALQLNVNPGSWGYLYGDGHAFRVSDANLGYSIAAGLGLNLLGFFGRRLPVDLYARWDSYFTGFQKTAAAYFSPSFLDVHSIGPEIRVRAWKIELAGNGGVTVALIQPASTGWFAGGSLGLTTRYVLFALRGDFREDPYYRSWRGWLALGIHP